MSKNSIRPDRVQPHEISELNLMFSCENCTYFKGYNNSCVLGLNTTPHLKSEQLKKFEISGQMLFCRFIEIE